MQHFLRELVSFIVNESRFPVVVVVIDIEEHL